MPRLEFTYPSWLPGFLSYFFLLVINAILPLIAIITVDSVATGVEITLVTFNSLASIILVSMLIYKMLMRSCVFNDVKHDKKAFLCVTVLDFCAAIGWPIRLDREAEFCAKLERRGTCHTAVIILGLVLAWISVVASACAAACANHGRKKRRSRRPSPLQLVSSRPVISSPMLIHAGQFTEEEDPNKLEGFTDIPLKPWEPAEEEPWKP